MASKIRELIDMAPGWQKIYDENALFRSRMGMRRKNSGLMLYPHLYSDTPSICKFHGELHDRLSSGSEWKAASGELSQTSLINGSWDPLLARAGYVMSPTATGMVDNHHLLEGLPTSFTSDRHKQIFTEFTKLFFGKAKLSPMSFKKSSSSGFPYFVPDVDLKVRLWEHGSAVAIANRGKSLSPSAWLLLQVPCFYITGARTQAEGTKVRKVWDGYEFVESSKAIPELPGFHCMRHRLVYAGAGAANYTINGIMTSVRAHYYSEFDRTYKVRFPSDIVDRFSRFGALKTIDVSNYDTTIQEWMFDELLKSLEEQEIFDRVFISLLRAMLGGPSASQSPYPLDQNKKWPLVGDPYVDETYAMSKGLMSGIAVVSDFGRFFMTWNLLCMLDNVTSDVVGNVDRYLKHQMPLAAFTNSSDDNFCGAATEAIMEKWLGTLDKPRASYFHVKIEEYMTYLGTTYYKTPSGLKHVPNLQSFLIKWQNAEHPISLDGKASSRRYWQDGWFGRIKLYDEHPQFRDLYQLTDSIFEKYHGIKMRDSITQGTQAKDLSISLTETDRIYLDNPDSIHYKIDINNVSPELIGMDLAQISAERISRVLNKLCGKGMEIYS